jgi:hypothetical protein
MAGATNRALKAAGIPKATIQTLRVESGGRLSLRSAIGMAHERKLPVGKAVEHMGPSEGQAQVVALREGGGRAEVRVSVGVSGCDHDYTFPSGARRRPYKNTSSPG